MNRDWKSFPALIKIIKIGVTVVHGMHIDRIRFHGLFLLLLLLLLLVLLLLLLLNVIVS